MTMTFEIPLLLDPADNPYLPHSLQTVSLDLNPADLAVEHPLPHFLPGTADPMSTADDDMDAQLDDIDDNSSDSLDSIEDHEFPAFFAQRGSPPRLFHSHGTYSLPVDGDEIKRQEAQHILLRMILGNNHDAPIRELLNDNPNECKVVDLCTGAGHWVLEMAEEFPRVEFRGLDLVPIQTRYPPLNVRFEIADVTERLRFADASVDVVHARMTCLRADVVPKFLQEVVRILRPGGLFLIAEWCVQPTLHPQHPSFVETYIPRTISFYNTVSDVVPTTAPQILHRIGQTCAFEEPACKQWAIPISTPSSTTSAALDFVSRVMGRVTQGYADALVAGGFVEREDADAFIDELDESAGVYSIYQTVCARKRFSG